MKIKFPNSNDTEQHECESYRDGEWIVFFCPLCRDYERRINQRTGKMEVKNSKEEINHFGSGEFSRHDYLYPLLNTN